MNQFELLLHWTPLTSFYQYFIGAAIVSLLLLFCSRLRLGRRFLYCSSPMEPVWKWRLLVSALAVAVVAYYVGEVAALSVSVQPNELPEVKDGRLRTMADLEEVLNYVDAYNGKTKDAKIMVRLVGFIGGLLLLCTFTIWRVLVKWMLSLSQVFGVIGIIFAASVILAFVFAYGVFVCTVVWLVALVYCLAGWRYCLLPEEGKKEQPGPQPSPKPRPVPKPTPEPEPEPEVVFVPVPVPVPDPVPVEEEGEWYRWLHLKLRGDAGSKVFKVNRSPHLVSGAQYASLAAQAAPLASLPACFQLEARNGGAIWMLMPLPGLPYTLCVDGMPISVLSPITAGQTISLMEPAPDAESASALFAELKVELIPEVRYIPPKHC